MPLSSEVIEIREYRASVDRAFIFSTWLKNYKHSSYFAKRIRPVVFFKGHHAVLDHLLAKPNTRIAVACSKDDVDQILGWLAYELGDDKPTVHYVFVKEAFRKMGVARTLFNAAEIAPESLRFSHWTFPVDELIQKYPEIIYDPYSL